MRERKAGKSSTAASQHCKVPSNAKQSFAYMMMSRIEQDMMSITATFEMIDADTIQVSSDADQIFDYFENLEKLIELGKQGKLDRFLHKRVREKAKVVISRPTTTPKPIQTEKVSSQNSTAVLDLTSINNNNASLILQIKLKNMRSGKRQRCSICQGLGHKARTCTRISKSNTI